MNRCKNCIHHDVCAILYANTINRLTDEDVLNCKHFVSSSDVAHVVYGKWEDMPDMAPPEYHGRHRCSMCGQLALYKKFHEELSDYCPDCGAKMWGGSLWLLNKIAKMEHDHDDV